jgi:hypothetical protein
VPSGRDKAGFDRFGQRDQSFVDADNASPHKVFAQEIVNDPKARLSSFDYLRVDVNGGDTQGLPSELPGPLH